MSTRQKPTSDTGKRPTVVVPSEHIHVDSAGRLKGINYLVSTNTFIKWPEVYEVTLTPEELTLKKLRKIYARSGVPKVPVSGNRTTDNVIITEEFCKFNI